MCPICSEQRSSASHMSEGLSFSRCDGCKHLFSNPPPTDDALSNFYSGDYWESRPTKSHNLFKKVLSRAPWMLQALMMRPGSFPNGDGKVLEIGSGPGAVVWSLSKILRIEPYAIEPDPGMRELLGELKVILIAPDVAAWFGVFDLVILSHVLEHQKDPRGLFDTAVKYLKPGGTLLVEVPNGDAGLDQGGFAHLSVFSKDSLRTLFGFTAGKPSFFTHSKSKRDPSVSEVYLLALLSTPEVGKKEAGAGRPPPDEQYVGLPDSFWQKAIRRLVRDLLFASFLLGRLARNILRRNP